VLNFFFELGTLFLEIEKVVELIRIKRDKNNSDKGEWQRLLQGPFSALEINKMTNTNKVILKEAIKELNTLKNENRITNGEFSSMMRLACSAFVENQIQVPVNKVIGN
jgi:hypothetical protein